MKLKKLDMRGFSHDIALVLFMVIFAIGGVGYLVASHAESCNPVSGAVSSGGLSGPVSDAISGPVTGPVSQTCQPDPITPPSNYAASQVTTNSFVYSFTPSVDNAMTSIVGYNTYRYITSAGPTTAVLYTAGGLNTQGSTIVGLNPGTTYSFYLEARDNFSPPHLSPPSNTITITTLPLITPPTNLRSANTNSNSTFLGWTPAVDNTAGSTLAGYDLYRYVTNAGPGTAVLSRLSPTTGLTLVDLSPGTTYSFYLQAFDTASPSHLSEPSSTINVTTSSSGEQLSRPPARRPAQYLHVCKFSSTTYVAQGTPNCLPGGTFLFNYDPSVPGTLYNVPCQATNTSALRYVYISSSEQCPSGTAAISGARLAPGEQLSFQPARRPVQYNHICHSSNVFYITQGSPNCLANDAFLGNYAPTVPGTLYSRACETTSGNLLRYVYISNPESCPIGTALVSPTIN
jgi:hypothetical protein